MRASRAVMRVMRFIAWCSLPIRGLGVRVLPRRQREARVLRQVVIAARVPLGAVVAVVPVGPVRRGSVVVPVRAELTAPQTLLPAVDRGRGEPGRTGLRGDGDR